MHSLMLPVLIVLSAWPVQDPEQGRSVPSLTVMGSGEVSVKPDMAEIQAGVLTQAASAAEALKTNSAAVAKLLELLAERGIAEKDIQTVQFNIGPYYDRGPRGEQRRQIAGYRVTNSVNVTVRDLKNLGRILDDLVGAGANQLGGVSFSVAEPEALMDEARKRAMADAKRKANLYAEAAGVMVGRVRFIQEQSPPVPRRQFFSAMRGAEAEGSVPIAPGEQDHTVTIAVTYAIE